MLDLTPLARYRPLIDDWDAFAEAVQRPLPTTVWTNTVRTDADALARWFAAEGLKATPIERLPDAFVLHDESPGTRLPYLTGLYHIQEEVSMLPPLLLAPQPGERVLDLCAAPGNKTAQIAVMMENTGTVVANDRHPMRLGVVRSMAERLGLVNVAATAYDAANYPPEAGHFDRVLADVPCSCEGTVRKSPGVLEQGGVDAARNLGALQAAILRKAVQRCRPGGRIVYSTCTFAPEENEAVVDTVLQDYPEAVDLVEASLPGWTTHPGVTAWNGRTYDPRLRRALRLWPHDNDTGGFFLAVLEKRS